MTENTIEMLETKSDTQSIDSNTSKMTKIFQNDDIQKAIDQVSRAESQSMGSSLNAIFAFMLDFADNSIRFDRKSGF